MRAFFSYGIALIIVLGISAWLATGTLVIGGKGPGNGERPIVELIEGEDGGALTSTLESTGLAAGHHAEGETDPALSIAQRQAAVAGETAPARSVRVKTFTAEAMPIEVPLRGRTKAKSTISVVAETNGVVEAVRVTKGQRVEPGALICTLDQGTRAAAVAQAEAGLAQAEASSLQAQADFETNAALRAKGVAPANTGRGLEVAVAAAQAAVSAAKSALDNAKAELARTEIHAKVGGVVQDPLASVGSMLAAGAPCATIVQLDPMLFVGNVPEARIGLARLGLPAKIETVTGATVEGKVSYISATADEATRSFAVEIEIPNADGALRDGVTAEAIVNIGTAPAHLLPQSVLTLDDDGVLGVRVVENGKVAFHPVQIVRDTRDGTWVTGLPMRMDVITVGQEFVQAGQPVDAQPADDEARS